MRVIKFRAKSEFSGDWWFGTELVADLHEPNTVALSHFWRMIEDGTLIEKTIGQYTGHPDKNGKEIYEGDIAKSDGHKMIFEVKFSLSFSGFDAESDHLILGIGQNAHVLEIIGNMCDNPELLKVKP